MAKQQIIPQKIIDMALFLQAAERFHRAVVMVQKRQSGKKAATKLANGEQILPAKEPSSN